MKVFEQLILWAMLLGAVGCFVAGVYLYTGSLTALFFTLAITLFFLFVCMA